MATHVSRVPHSKLLRAAGVVSLVAAVGHVQMGMSELAPGIRDNDVRASTALKGWFQGSFGYAVFGLNYLRLAKIQPSSFDMLDRLTVLFQALMHLYTLVGLTQPPPRAISAIILSCIGGGLLGA